MDLSENKILENLSLLYELSLGVGRSTDLKENCFHFLRILMARKNFSFSAVWLRNPKNGTLELKYSLPEFKHDSDEGFNTDEFQSLLRVKPYVVIQNEVLEYNNLPFSKRYPNGVSVLFRLKEVGILQIYKSKAKVFDPIELVQLKVVMEKFAISIESCLTFIDLKIETARRRRIQQSLTQQNNNYQDLFMNIYDALIITDAKGYILNVNKAGIEQFKINRFEVGKFHFLDFVHPDDKELASQYADQRQREGYFSKLQLRVVTMDGEERLVQINSSAVYDGRQYIGSRDLIRDITEEKKAERQIAENEDKFRQVINTSLDAVVIIDSKSIVVEWNENAQSILGYSKIEAMGQTLSDLIIPHKFREAHKRGMKHFMRTGEGPVLNKRIEITALHKTGKVFPIELSIAHFKLDGEDYFSAFLRDITERKNTENALIKAKQQADQARLAEQQFLANMSHEIRTPMNAVIGMSDLLRDTPLDSEQIDYVNSLNFSAQSLMGIINNILDLSKIEAGKMMLERRRFDLKLLLNSLVNTFHFKLKDRNVDLTMHYDSNISEHLIGDSNKLNQILMNLLSNAIKFTEEGFIKLTINLLEEESERLVLEFIVEDSGIGISPEKLDVIFESFKQADEKVARKFGGTGLGLSIVKQMVQLQGGRLNVESTISEGSKFSVQLPYDKYKGSIAEVGQYNFEETNTSDQLKRNLQVLIVEDNPMNQKLISRNMEKWGIYYKITQNGFYGVLESYKRVYDIIFMDVQMPEMDGFDATKWIRLDPQNPNQRSPIIALTAAALQEHKNKAKTFGMNDFLSKPFSRQQLLNVLIKWQNTGDELRSRGRAYSDNHYIREVLSLGTSSREMILDRLEKLDQLNVFLARYSAPTERYLNLLGQKLEELKGFLPFRFQFLIEYFKVLKENSKRNYSEIEMLVSSFENLLSQYLIVIRKQLPTEEKS